MFNSFTRLTLRTFLYSILTTILAIMVWNTYELNFMGIDDANIYFVYMKNFANHGEFVYNVGGERVEGFTSMAWTLIGSFIFRIVHNPEQTLFITNLIIVATGLGYFLAKTDEWMKIKMPVSIHSLGILATLFIFPGYFDWTVVSMLETGLWSIILLLSIANIIDYSFGDSSKKKSLNIQLSILLFLLPIIRPEAIILGPVLAMIRISQGHFVWSGPGKRNFYPLLSILISLFVLTTFRLSYFGFPLPNTYYAKIIVDKKVAFQYGRDYFLSFSNKWNYLFYPLSIITILTFIGSTFSRILPLGITFQSKQLFYLSLFGLLSLLIPLYEGGDHFYLGRFYQPLMPLMLFILFKLFFDLGHFFTKFWRWFLKSAIIPALIIAFCVLINPVTTIQSIKGQHPGLWNEFEITHSSYRQAIKMEEFFNLQPGLPSVGTAAAGSFAYNYNGVTIDLMGLNNVAMAHKERKKYGYKNHSSFNKEVFLSQKPDLFLYSYALELDTSAYHFERNGFQDWIYKDIMDNEVFRDTYLPIWIVRKDNGRALHSWASKEFINQIDTTSYTIIEMKVQ